MGNQLSVERAAAVVAALVEGASVSGASRLTGVCRPAIYLLLRRMGEGCRRIHDRLVRNLITALLQVDEMHGFVHTREKNKRPTDPAEWGEVWLFFGLATVSKLIVSWRLGKRDQATTDAFMADLRARLAVIPQLSSDGFGCYASAVNGCFKDSGVDFGQVVKRKSDLRSKKPRTSDQPFIVRTAVSGAPDPKHLSTSLVERINGSARLALRRLTRRSNGFSRTKQALEDMVAIWATYYNFARPHETIRCSPAMEAGIATSLWSIEELVRAALDEPVGAAPERQPLRPREGAIGAMRQTSSGSWLRIVPKPGAAQTAPSIVKAPSPQLLKKPAPKPPLVAIPEQLNLFDE